MSRLGRHLLLRQHHDLIKRRRINILQTAFFNYHFNLLFRQRRVLRLLLAARGTCHQSVTNASSLGRATALANLRGTISQILSVIVCCFIIWWNLILLCNILTTSSTNMLRLISLTVVLFRVQMRAQQRLDILM